MLKCPLADFFKNLIIFNSHQICIPVISLLKPIPYPFRPSLPGIGHALTHGTEGRSFVAAAGRRRQPTSMATWSRLAAPAPRSMPAHPVDASAPPRPATASQPRDRCSAIARRRLPFGCCSATASRRPRRRQPATSRRVGGWLGGIDATKFAVSDPMSWLRRRLPRACRNESVRGGRLMRPQQAGAVPIAAVGERWGGRGGRLELCRRWASCLSVPSSLVRAWMGKKERNEGIKGKTGMQIWWE